MACCGRLRCTVGRSGRWRGFGTGHFRGLLPRGRRSGGRRRRRRREPSGSYSLRPRGSQSWPHGWVGAGRQVGENRVEVGAGAGGHTAETRSSCSARVSRPAEVCAASWLAAMSRSASPDARTTANVSAIHEAPRLDADVAVGRQGPLPVADDERVRPAVRTVRLISSAGQRSGARGRGEPDRPSLISKGTAAPGAEPGCLEPSCGSGAGHRRPKAAPHPACGNYSACMDRYAL